MQTFYTLDADNRILTTGGDWDAFARANDGEAALSMEVVGRPIWDFIDGADVRSQFNALLFSLRRHGGEAELTYRCDAPWERRLMRMRATPKADGCVTLTHDLLSAERAAVPPIAYRRGGGERCAICGGVHDGQRWLDPFDAPTRVYEVGEETICPACRAATSEAIDAMRTA